MRPNRSRALDLRSLLSGGCVAVVSVSSKALRHIGTKKDTVVYSVTGSGPANITYATTIDGKNDGVHITGVTLPWTKTVTGSDQFSLFAAPEVNGGTITCSITIDGKRVATQTSTSQIGSAICLGG
jgi:hypothetical protein